MTFEDREKQYQQGAAEFQLSQREAELEQRRTDAEQIASGRNMLNGQAVTRAEMDQYQRGVEQSSAKAHAYFNRENPFYASVKASMPRAPQPDQFSNDQDYQSAISEYLSTANKGAREREFNRKLSQSRKNALTNSINQFKNDPMGYLLGGGREGSSTYSPDALMDYLGQASQLFSATGQEGNFMDFILGGSSTGQGAESSDQLRRNQFLSNQKARSTQDYVYRNLTPSERADPNLNSTARMKARRENFQERQEAERAFNA
tara:strand:- start:52 stop:834 length:783 start_codon:yes stop_codon:yes gene_type:complete